MQEAVDYLDVNAALAMADMLLVGLSRTSSNDNLWSDFVRSLSSAQSAEMGSNGCVRQGILKSLPVEEVTGGWHKCQWVNHAHCTFFVQSVSSLHLCTFTQKVVWGVEANHDAHEKHLHCFLSSCVCERPHAVYDVCYISCGLARGRLLIWRRSGRRGECSAGLTACSGQPTAALPLEPIPSTSARWAPAGTYLP